jgi:tetratricopeptide (TPR) repeat protein
MIEGLKLLLFKIALATHVGWFVGLVLVNQIRFFLKSYKSSILMMILSLVVLMQLLGHYSDNPRSVRVFRPKKLPPNTTGLVEKSLTKFEAEIMLKNIVLNLEAQPPTRDKLINAALLSYQLGDVKQSEKYFIKAKKLDPNHKFLKNYLSDFSDLFSSGEAGF